MLGLFERKSGHPLADPKSAAELMANLPRQDGLRALQELTDWLDSVRRDDGFRLDERFAAIRLLDEHARPHKRKLTREFYSSPSLSGFRQNRLWTSLHDFVTQLAGSYGEVLAGCRNGDKGVAALKQQRPLLAARSVHAARGRLKCAVAHYAEATDDVWRLLAQGYALAENGGYLDEAVTLYPGMRRESSVHDEFAGSLLWWCPELA